MTLTQLMDYVLDKSRFESMEAYSEFCAYYLEYIYNNLQAVIVSKNEGKSNHECCVQNTTSIH